MKLDFSKPLKEDFTSCKQCINYDTSLFAMPCNRCVAENFVYDSVISQWKRKGVTN